MDDNVHSIPLYSRPHEFSEDCWCKPTWGTECPDMLIHNKVKPEDLS